MQKNIVLYVPPSQLSNVTYIYQEIAKQLHIAVSDITGYYIVKKSIDARQKKHIWFYVSLMVSIGEPFINRPLYKTYPQDVSRATKKVIIVGMGPAGLFAAWKLIELGIQPILIDRGKSVRNRRRDIALLNKEGNINADSNYCFGEGGAGTYSDGKLYTRSNKRGNISDILSLFIRWGAEDNILYESHPHIGTNKLPLIISRMTEEIQQYGGKVLFDTKLEDMVLLNNHIKEIKTNQGVLSADAFIIATGHSARDIFYLLYKKSIYIEKKPFALGVRVEHPQEIVNQWTYHQSQLSHDACLPPASYTMVEQIEGNGVFSFCMCPGGIIATASTQAEELVINGWSPSKRNNPFANSGIVVNITDKLVANYAKEINHKILLSKIQANDPLTFMIFQEMIEKKAYQAGEGHFKAPAQRITDFCTHQLSSSLPPCSYIPGVQSASLAQVLPYTIQDSLSKAFRLIGAKRHGFYSENTIVLATESRTSSPIRIPRNEKGHHVEIKNLYPCGEGAGYAGGIMSAAMDGQYIATNIYKTFTA